MNNVVMLFLQDTSRPIKGKRGTGKEKGEQGRKKGKRTDNSYCLFPHNNYCPRKFSKVK
jgi:hypothetical protein